MPTKKYLVTYKTVTTGTVTVDANDETQAAEIAKHCVEYLTCCNEFPPDEPVSLNTCIDNTEIVSTCLCPRPLH